MKSFAEKVKEARFELNISQAKLAELVGVSMRAIQTYEQGMKKPRQGVVLKLAKALNVSVKYLTDENCDDPVADIAKDGYIEEAHERYGAAGARDINALLADNTALFAGGELSQEQKDAFFEAIMRAYIISKDAARLKFTPRNN